MSEKKSPFRDTKDLFAKTMRDRKLEKVKFKWKRSLIMIACGILLYGVLKLFLALDLTYSFIVWFIYEGVAGAAVVAYVVTVRGDLSSKPPTEDMLPDHWSEKEKYDYLKLCMKRRAAGKFGVVHGVVSRKGIGNGADHGKRSFVHVTDLGNGRAFHFTSDGIEKGLQAHFFLLFCNKTVAGSNDPCRRGNVFFFGQGEDLFGEGFIGGKKDFVDAGDQPHRISQGRGVHIVLNQAFRYGQGKDIQFFRQRPCHA